jgi:hypothetical protein
MACGWPTEPPDAPKIPGRLGLQSGIAGRLSGRLLDLADQVRRLDPPGGMIPNSSGAIRRNWPGQIAALAYDAQSRLG